ncbi:hypothetical protein M8C21_006187 [Ambrosia artemisiifolia]|uniref:Major facilitator superfamily (MFS) profile domain-containing protein n=1 Tax=Ambrosia artemisiifolia TaxID=4212 RepID=A0AAD5C2L1_AMBAR|nr:hypothetical protein M8C21_006187 [Ambrosia artemisiifolia]
MLCHLHHSTTITTNTTLIMPETNTTSSWGLSHLFVTVFLFNFSHFMVIPAITDVSMAALCPGEDECSFAIYLTGVQQANYQITGIGSLLMMPLIGNLSDQYGRKVLLTYPMTLAIFPTVILAYSREKGFFYAYFVLKTLTSMLCEGTVIFLALAYVADNVAEQRRASAFGILSGISSCAFVTGNLLTRFLPSTASVFQVSAATVMVSVLYMRIFLPESNKIAVTSEKEATDECLIEKENVNNRPRRIPSLRDSFSLLKSSSTFSQAAIVAFFNMLGDLGLMSALLYYLKAEFHFDKDQYADLMIIHGIAGIISQMIVMPVLNRVISEECLLAIGLAFNCLHISLLAVAWSSWLRSIVSKQVGPTEQGKAQGCITGLCSFAGIISPLIFSPLTALFLSDHPPFHFPGFSLMCAAFAVMIAFIQSIMIKAPISNSKTDEYEPLAEP